MDVRSKATEGAVIVILTAGLTRGTMLRIRPGQAADGEARKSDPACDRVGVLGERPSRTDQRRATVHAAMGDVLEIVRFRAIVIPCGCDGRDRHPVSAMRAGEEETR